MRPLLLQKAELQSFLFEIYPQTRDRVEILHLEPMYIEMKMFVTEADIRPGGTLSGPTMFTLADCAFYAATLALIGKEGLTVTTNLSMNFMRKPKPCDLVAKARVLKLGKTLSVGDALLYSVDEEAPVAHASITFSIPPAP